MIGKATPDRGGSSPIEPQVVDRGDGLNDPAAQYPPPRVVERREVEPIRADTAVGPARTARASGSPPPRRRLDWAIVIALFGIAVFAIERLLVDALNWIATTYDRNAVLGLVALAALVAGVVGALFVIARQLRSFFALRKVEALQGELEHADRLSIDATQHSIAGVLGALRGRPDSRPAIARFERQVQPQHTSVQRIAILSETVLKPLDRSAEDAVRRGASRAFGISAISPTALTHALFFLAVCVRMMREITSAYGHRPTLATTVHLLRRLVVEAGKVGGLDIAMAAMGTHMLTGIVERLGAGAAESAYAAQRMARLGIITMAMCRPVPFRSEEVPSLPSLVGNLMQRGE